MTRMELTVAIAVALALAAVCGWALHWLWGRLLRGGAHDLAEHSEMADLLLAAKAERDAAVERERETRQRLADEKLAVETDLKARIAEREAELSAMMETIGDLRRQVVEWRRQEEENRKTEGS